MIIETQMEIAVNVLIDEIDRCERHLAKFQHIRDSDVYKNMEFKVAELKRAVTYLLESKFKNLNLSDVIVSVCYNRDCFYYDKTDNTCVGNYKACTVKQTGC